MAKRSAAERLALFAQGVRIREHRRGPVDYGEEWVTACLTPAQGLSPEDLLIRFDAALGKTVALLGAEGVDEDSLALRHGGDVRNILQIHTLMCRFASFNPVDFGLRTSRSQTPRRFRYSGDRVAFHAQEMFDFGMELKDLVTPEVLRLIPNYIVAADVVTHAPEADLSVFGTPVLVPMTRNEIEGLGENRLCPDAGWAMAQVGLENEKPLAFVAWDDEEGLSRLAEQVKHFDAAMALSLRAMMGDEGECFDMRECRYDFDRTMLLPQAREEWESGRAVRPILAARAITAAKDAVGIDGGWTRRIAVADILKTQDKSVAAMSFTPPKRCSRQKIARFLEDLNDRLAGTGLGEALIVEERYRVSPTVVVVKDREYLDRYLPLFGYLGRVEI